MSRKSYLDWDLDQTYLLPPSLRDWLPVDHLVYFVLDVVGSIDLSAVVEAIRAKDPRGQKPYHPTMMVALLVYGYCTGVFSSRRLERACREDVAFRVLTANQQPHFTTINEFRRTHRAAFAGLFLEILRLCDKAGLVKLGHVAIDGTKVEAHASKHKAMSYERMKQKEKRLQEEIEDLLDEAERVDASEDARHGEGRREWEPPLRRGKPPDDLAAQEQMRWRLDTARGRAVYARRKAVVEPVFGQIRVRQRFNRLSFRGLQAVRAEWKLVAACHNIWKLFGQASTFALAA